MPNFKIIVSYLCYHNKPYTCRTPKHFLKFWSKTWGGGIKDMLSGPHVKTWREPIPPITP